MGFYRHFSVDRWDANCSANVIGNTSGFRYAFLPHAYVSLQVSTITTSRVSYKYLQKVTQMLCVFRDMSFIVFLSKIRKSKMLALVGCPRTFVLDVFSHLEFVGRRC